MFMDWVYQSCSPERIKEYQPVLLAAMTYSLSKMSESTKKIFLQRYQYEFSLALVRRMLKHRVQIRISTSSYTALLHECTRFPHLLTILNEHVHFEPMESLSADHTVRLVIEGEELVPLREIPCVATSTTSPSLSVACARMTASDVICVGSTSTSLVASFEHTCAPRLYTHIDGIPYGSASMECVGHTKPVFDIQWTSDQEHFMTASADGTVRYWTPTSEGISSTVYSVSKSTSASIPPRPCWSVAPHPKHAIFASSGEYSHLILGHLERNRPQTYQTLHGHDKEVQFVEWHPSISLLLSASVDKTVKVWDVRQPKAVRTLYGAIHTVTSLACFGYQVTVGTCAGELVTWNLTDTRIMREETLPSHAPIYALTYTRLGSLAVAHERSVSLYTDGEATPRVLTSSANEGRIIHLDSFYKQEEKNEEMIFTVLS
jgi:hypothetical protein